MRLTLAVALLAASVLPPLVAAGSSGQCDGEGAVALGIVEIGTGSASNTFYVDDRNYVLGNGMWLYQESNGIFFGGDGARDLQRGGSSPYQPNDNEICQDDSVKGPDTLIS